MGFTRVVFMCGCFLRDFIRAYLDFIGFHEGLCGLLRMFYVGFTYTPKPKP